MRGKRRKGGGRGRLDGAEPWQVSELKPWVTGSWFLERDCSSFLDVFIYFWLAKFHLVSIMLGEGTHLEHVQRQHKLSQRPQHAWKRKWVKISAAVKWKEEEEGRAGRGGEEECLDRREEVEEDGEGQREGGEDGGARSRPPHQPTHTTHTDKHTRTHTLRSEVHLQFTLTITTPRRKRAEGRAWDA